MTLLLYQYTTVVGEARQCSLNAYNNKIMFTPLIVNLNLKKNNG